MRPADLTLSAGPNDVSSGVKAALGAPIAYHYDPAFRAPKDKVDHNAQTVESLRKSHDAYFAVMDKHVAELNKKYSTTAVRVAPVGQAVVKLREKIIAGEAPGLKDQNVRAHPASSTEVR